jgi:hypothetical protein
MDVTSHRLGHLQRLRVFAFRLSQEACSEASADEVAHDGEGANRSAARVSRCAPLLSNTIWPVVDRSKWRRPGRNDDLVASGVHLPGNMAVSG